MFCHGCDLWSHDVHAERLVRLVRFTGVSEKEFNSIFRRSLVIKFKARFVDPQWLRENLPNAEQYGVFPRREDLKELLTTSVGALCGLRIQHAFEARNTRLRILP